MVKLSIVYMLTWRLQRLTTLQRSWISSVQRHEQPISSFLFVRPGICCSTTLGNRVSIWCGPLCRLVQLQKIQVVQTKTGSLVFCWFTNYCMTFFVTTLGGTTESKDRCGKDGVLNKLFFKRVWHKRRAKQTSWSKTLSSKCCVLWWWQCWLK